jgi:hypothetical protein
MGSAFEEGKAGEGVEFNRGHVLEKDSEQVFSWSSTA